MANKMVLNKDEINQFTQDLIVYHKEILSGIALVQRKMNGLNGSGDVFHLDKTSKKIKELLDTVNTDIIPILQNTLWESNRCADLLIQIMNGLDS